VILVKLYVAMTATISMAKDLVAVAVTNIPTSRSETLKKKNLRSKPLS
jgi:hypothetical protein